MIDNDPSGAADEQSDLATLSWCIGEIRDSLATCAERLRERLDSGGRRDDGGDTHADADADASVLAAARASLHQAHGALAIVDVAGVSMVTGEAEQLLERIARGQVALDADVHRRFSEAFSAVTEYLDELLLGEPQQPLYLFPYYRALLEVRSAERIHPADLYAVPVMARLVVADTAMRRRDPSELAATRVDFERGLLSVLRNADDLGAIAALHAAVLTIGSSQVGAAHPTFWKVALAWLEALRDRTLALDVYGKRLLARLNLQLRRSLADGAPVAERLLKDTLFALARIDVSSTSISPLVAEVRRAFRLADSVPGDFDTPRFGRVDTRSIVDAKEAIARAKLAWEKLARGSAPDLATFAQAIAALRTAAGSLPFPGVRGLADAFGETSRLLALDASALSETLALEAASALLFAEQIFERGLKGQADYDSRAAEMAARLVQTASGSPPDDEMPQWLRDISHAAQERLTMATFIVETQGNLRSAEQALDSFFRDATQRADLPQTVRQLHQVSGALQLLGHQEAASAASAVAAQVQSFAADDEAPAVERCEAVADSVGALGFFVEGLQQAGRAGARFEYDRETGRFHAILNEPRPDPVSVVVSLDATAESLVAQHAQRAGELVASLSERPDDAEARDALRRTLAQVRDDANLVDDASLKSHAEEAIARIDADGDLDLGSLRAAVAQLPGAAAAEEAPVVEEPEREESEIDSELLEIFLGEAQEVLGAIESAAAGSRSAPTDDALLMTIRRGFHTLKGSSRMVGLDAFGDAAWSMEQVLNLWLAEERAGTSALYELIELARVGFAKWVEALQSGRVPNVDAAALVDAATTLRDGEPHEEAFARLAAALGEAGTASVDADATHAVDAGEASNVEAEAGDEAVEARDEAVAGGVEASDVSVADDVDPVDIPETIAAQSTAIQESIEARPIEAAAIHVESIEPDPIEADSIDDESVVAESIEAEPIEASAGSDVSPDEVRIGDRTIGRSLYEIFLSEADELIDTLSVDAFDWMQQPTRVASERAQRAMHSLKGSTALVSLGEVQSLAEQLETFLLRQRAVARPIGADDLNDYAHAIERMQAMLHQFAAGQQPRPEPDCFALAHALAARWDPRTLPSEFAAGGADSDLDAELLPLFVEEASDLLPRIGQNLRDWLASPGERPLQQQLMRDLHTVKGSARMAGAMSLGQRVHEMETRIEAAIVLSVVPASLIEELIADHDEVVAMFESIRDPGTASAHAGLQAAPQVRVAQSAGTAHAANDASQPREPAPHPVQAPHSAQATQSAQAAQTGATGTTIAVPAQPKPAAPGAGALVRVRGDLLERVVNESGEVSIARSRLDNELGTLRVSLQDLTENVARLRSQLREIEIQAESQIQARFASQKETNVEFDPLEFDRYTRFQELARMLAESVNDVATVQQNAMRSLDGASQDMLRHTQVLRDLQQNLMRMRMVQFGSIGDRLYRVVRQAGKELGKRVSLDLRGALVEVDRGVLERMAAPIEHLLRNAVAHGIEPASVRKASDKPEAGEIRLEVRQEGNEVVLVFADDGAGLDLRKILARARQAGIVDAGAEPTEREIVDLIFVPGFSTASEVTELSGRGVGTDVVRAEVLALGGRIEVESSAGVGTRFTIHLPLTMAIAQVVLVTVGTTQYAIPSSSVEQVLQLKPQALADAYDRGSIDWQDAAVPLHYLGALVGFDDAHAVAQHLSPVLVVRSGNLRLAIHVDTVSRNQEIVVKNVGAQAASVQGIGGATVLGNGEIVLILNPARLAQAVLGDLWLDRPPGGMRRALAEAPPTVMVVDDSLTVRKATQRLLLREGYEVMLAKDGVDALRQLQDRQPDLMIVDIEMPRMDGFDLTRNVRTDERMRDTPIVMITSRTADKHRNHAMSLGVNVYLGKPYRDDELLAHIASFTRKSAGSTRHGS